MHASDALCIEPSLLKKFIISDFLGAMPGIRYRTNEIPEKLIIQGITKTGKAFRSGDWVERLCGVMSVFGADQQIRYSQHVRSIMMDRVGWGVSEGRLAPMEPRAYCFMLGFACVNDLNVVDPADPNPEEDCCELPLPVGEPRYTWPIIKNTAQSRRSWSWNN